MNLVRLPCRPSEGMVQCRSHGRSLQRTEVEGRCYRDLQGSVEQLEPLGRSQERIVIVRSALSSRNLTRVGAQWTWRSSLDSTIINATLQKQILPGVLHNYSTRQIAKACTTLGPIFVFHRCRGLGQNVSKGKAIFSCKAVIESGSPAGTTPDDKAPAHGSDPKADGRVEDGSILTGDGSELRNTVRLVECSMLAATAGLAYFLSNLLRLEVATAMLLLILSGPLKAASYLLMHGFVGLAMGAFWKWNFNWGLSIVGCTLVRCLGALGFILLTSWLLRDNILALITMNAHASLSYMLAALGFNLVPTMPMIYVVFGTLLVLNCGSFVFLLHVLYAIFLRRLGLRGSITVPGWVERAM